MYVGEWILLSPSALTYMVMSVENVPYLQKRLNEYLGRVNCCRLALDVITRLTRISRPSQSLSSNELTELFPFHNAVLQRASDTFASFTLVPIITCTIEQAVSGFDRVVHSL
jgi:hypothetical protein